MIHSKKSLRLLAVALTAAAVVGVSACKKSATNTSSTATTGAEVIKIGEVGSMTGSEATFGTSTHNGIELAIK